MASSTTNSAAASRAKNGPQQEAPKHPPYHQYGRPPTEEDYQAFERCGISRKTVDAAQIRRVDDYEGREITGSQKKKRDVSFAGLDFPTFWPGKPAPRRHRLRHDRPELERKAESTVKQVAK